MRTVGICSREFLRHQLSHIPRPPRGSCVNVRERSLHAVAAEGEAVADGPGVGVGAAAALGREIQSAVSVMSEYKH